MKKFLLLFGPYALLFSFSIAFAYTGGDLSNAQYLAAQGTIVEQNTNSNYRLDETILRQEVIGMALKISGIELPEGYKCKKYFSDTTKDDWVCRAIETAAINGIISADNAKARPSDKITRAEALSILIHASNTELDNGRYTGNWLTDKGFADWQAKLLISIVNCNIYNKNISCESAEEIVDAIGNFQPNTWATRADVFNFAANIIASHNQNTEATLTPTNTVTTTTTAKDFPINLLNNKKWEIFVKIISPIDTYPSYSGFYITKYEDNKFKITPYSFDDRTGEYSESAYEKGYSAWLNTKGEKSYLEIYYGYYLYENIQVGHRSITYKIPIDIIASEVEGLYSYYREGITSSDSYGTSESKMQIQIINKESSENECVIKGESGFSGTKKIYYKKDSKYYDRLSSNFRCFTSESDAEKEGYTKSLT